ncbi:MAG TPA: hypothetical protein VMP68_29660 [Candidatus Eisenbacteria bacterium]|nr:hypothetical protein [Candidatus Eisenbacteria bacterium]
MLDEIVKELETSPNQGGSVPLAQVRNWMNSDDTDTLGATYGFLSNAGQVNRVTPALEFEEVFSFMLKYFEYCFRTDPKSRWANGRYSAGWDLTGWFTQMWDEKRDRKYFEAIKSMLGKLYVEGDAGLKGCIEDSVIEHLFERKPIRKFFDDWQGDPDLRPAYEQGKAWVDGGGKSPLTESRVPRGT